MPSSAHVATLPDAPKAHIAPNVWTHASGLTVVHRTLVTAPVVAVQVWVGVGAAHETAAQYGMAHVHEHMVFKGTERRGVGQMAAELEAAGGSINAWTSIEETVYHTVLPARAAELGIDALLDGTLMPRFDPEELQKELEVIREEIRRGDDVPARSHIEHVFSSAWPQHPYGERVIGSCESVSAFDENALRAFHERWYHPRNMTLVVVGDCLREDVERWVDAAMPYLDVTEFLGAPVPKPATTAVQRPVVEYREVENSRVTIAFDGPTLSNPDHPATELLCMLLAGMNSSVLYDRLVRTDRLALDAWSDVLALEQDGLVLAGATFAPDASIHRILRILGEEWANLIDRVRPADLQRAKRSFESAHLMTEATVQGLGNTYGTGAIHHGGPDWQHVWMDQLRAVTLEDIRRVATSVLRPDRLRIVAQLPLEQAKDEVRPTSLMDAFVDGFTRENTPAAVQKAPDHQGYQYHVLENGIRLIVQPDRSLPVFSMSMGVLGGALRDDAPTAGRATMMAGLLTAGNTYFDTAALEREMDALGCRASANAGQLTSVFAMSALRDEQHASLDLARACWFESRFDDNEVQRAKRVRLRALQQRQETPGYLAHRALQNTFFPDHPWARPTVGTLASIKALSAADLRAAHAALPGPEAMVVSAVGDMNVANLIDQLSGWKKTVHSEAEPTRIPDAPAWPDAQTVNIEHRRKQAVVYVAYPGIGLESEDRATLRVLVSIMSGQGGRLFMALREKRSMAYSVSMGYDTFANTGIVYGRMETSPEKIDDAIIGMREQLERLRDAPLEDTEVRRARARVAGQTQVGLQLGATRAAVVTRDTLTGRGYRHGLDIAERIEPVDAVSIQKLAGRLLRQEHEVVIVARPKHN